MAARPHTASLILRYPERRCCIRLRVVIAIDAGANAVLNAILNPIYNPRHRLRSRRGLLTRLALTRDTHRGPGNSSGTNRSHAGRLGTQLSRLFVLWLRRTRLHSSSRAAR